MYSFPSKRSNTFQYKFLLSLCFIIFIFITIASLIVIALIPTYLSKHDIQINPNSINYPLNVTYLIMNTNTDSSFDFNSIDRGDISTSFENALDLKQQQILQVTQVFRNTVVQKRSISRPKRYLGCDRDMTNLTGPAVIFQFRANYPRDRLCKSSSCINKWLEKIVQQFKTTRTISTDFQGRLFTLQICSIGVFPIITSEEVLYNTTIPTIPSSIPNSPTIEQSTQTKPSSSTTTPLIIKSTHTTEVTTKSTHTTELTTKSIHTTQLTTKFIHTTQLTTKFIHTTQLTTKSTHTSQLINPTTTLIDTTRYNSQVPDFTTNSIAALQSTTKMILSLPSTSHAAETSTSTTTSTITSTTTSTSTSTSTISEDWTIEEGIYRCNETDAKASGSEASDRLFHTGLYIARENTVLIVGGGTNIATLRGTNVIEKYDAATGELKTVYICEILDNRYSVTADFIPSSRKILLAGGADLDKNLVLKTAAIFDPILNTMKIIEMTNVRMQHVSAISTSSQKIVLLGGLDTLASLTYGDTGDVYNGSVFEPVENRLDAGRVFHTGTYLPTIDKMLIVGGEIYQSSAFVPLNSIELYDVKSNRFEGTIGNMSSVRFGHSATYIPAPINKVFILGGASAPGLYLQNYTIFDVETMQITSSGELGSAYYGHSMTLLKDQETLLILGYDPYARLPICQTFNVRLEKLSTVACPKTPRLLHSATVVESTGKILLCQGVKLDDTTAIHLKDCELYVPPDV